MGYKRGGKRHTLTWAKGAELHGLVVQVRSLSIEGLLGFARLAARFTDDVAPGELGEVAGQLFDGFASRLVSWNLEDDDGAPVPATREGVGGQDVEFILAIVMAWMEAVAAVDTPLPNGSRTMPPTEASIPMEPLAASQPN